jgi:hypothetical protein
VTGPRFEIRPMAAWTGPATPAWRRRPASTFRAGWDDTVELLKKEVEHLGGKVIAVQVDASADEVRRDGMLRARARVGSPAVKISFDSKHGPLTYATDVYDHWQANVRAITLALQALRAVDRYGVSTSGEQYRGWAQLDTAPADVAMTPDAAAALLAEESGLPAGRIRLDPEVRARAYKRAAAKLHPDVGGDAALFDLITRARDLLAGQAPGG